MKQELQSLHGEVKSFRKAAEDRLEDVFFTHPEYRKLKTAAAVKWMIDRVRELDYPFSEKKEPMLSIWNQVLQEKRDKMVEEIEAAEEKESKKKTVYIKHVPEQGGHDHRKFMTEAGHGPGQHTQGIDPEFLRPLLGKVMVRVDVERLRKDIKAERAASKIAHELKISPAYVSLILKDNASASMKRRLPGIADAFSKLSKNHNMYGIYSVAGRAPAVPSLDPISQNDLLQADHDAALKSIQETMSGKSQELTASQISPADLESLSKATRGLFEERRFPELLISDLNAAILNAKVAMEMIVKLAQAIELYNQHYLKFARPSVMKIIPTIE